MIRLRPLLVARYYVLTTASLAAGLLDWIAQGTHRRLGPGPGHAMIKRALRSRRRRLPGGRDRARWWRRWPLMVRLESAGNPIYTQTRVGKDGVPFRIYKLRTMVSGAELRAPAWPSARATAGSRGSARCCGALARRAAQPLERGARGDVDRRPAARRCSTRSTATPSTSAAAWPSSRGSPAGRRSTVAPRCRGPSGSSSTSGTSSTARWRSTCGSCAARSGWSCAARASTRAATGGWEPPATPSGRADPRRDVAVLLTGVGKRYALVSAFSQHAVTIAADPNPLAPAQYAAHRPPLGPALRRPRLRAGAAGALPRSSASARWCRSPTSTSRSSGTPAATACCPRSSPTARSPARRSTSTRPTCCSSASACRRRRRCCRASRSTPIR